MKKIITIVAALLFFTLPLLSMESHSGNVQDDQKKIQQIMGLMILMLENGHADELLYRFAEPSFLEKTDEEHLLKAGKRFKEGRYRSLLKALKASINVQAKIDGNKALVKNPQGKDLMFIKIKGIWYLKN
jgi:hypothetical protein